MGGRGVILMFAVLAGKVAAAKLKGPIGQRGPDHADEALVTPRSTPMNGMKLLEFLPSAFITSQPVSHSPRNQGRKRRP